VRLGGAERSSDKQKELSQNESNLVRFGNLAPNISSFEIKPFFLPNIVYKIRKRNL